MNNVKSKSDLKVTFIYDMKNWNKEEKLMAIREDVKKVGGYFRQITEELSRQEISDHPIYIAHMEENLSIGKPIATSKDSETNFNYQASLLEELIRLKVLEGEKLEEFNVHILDFH